MRSWLVMFAVVGACSSETPFVTAPHTALPNIDGHQKVVLASPELVTITFPGYAHTDRVEALADFLGGSSWLRTVGAEYGVGASTSRAKVRWPTAAPATFNDLDLRKIISMGIDDGTLPKPAASGSQIVYVMYVPNTSILDATSTGAGVLCFRGSAHSAGGLFAAGYHGTFVTTDKVTVPYAVIGDCSDDEGLTTIASRELIGSFTNPYEVDYSGYLLDVPTTDPWFLEVDAGELGYLCTRETAAEEGGWKLNRSWSNAEAALGHEPCLPAPAGEVYFNVSASPSTVVTASAGEKVTFTLTGWSTSATPDWDLILKQADGASLKMEALAPVLSATHINNAVTVTLSLTVPVSAKSAQFGGVAVRSGPTERVWPVGFTVK